MTIEGGPNWRSESQYGGKLVLSNGRRWLGDESNGFPASELTPAASILSVEEPEVVTEPHKELVAT